jgi:hypothetical protein
MTTPEFSSPEDAAIINALNYWIDDWDWECPTLFGRELTEVQAIRDRWPVVDNAKLSQSALAIIGALRELLYGAGAVGSEQVRAICGMHSDEVTALSEKVRRWVEQSK